MMAMEMQIEKVVWVVLGRKIDKGHWTRERVALNNWSMAEPQGHLGSALGSALGWAARDDITDVQLAVRIGGFGMVPIIDLQADYTEQMYVDWRDTALARVNGIRLVVPPPTDTPDETWVLAVGSPFDDEGVTLVGPLRSGEECDEEQNEWDGDYATFDAVRLEKPRRF